MPTRLLAAATTSPSTCSSVVSLPTANHWSASQCSKTKQKKCSNQSGMRQRCSLGSSLRLRFAPQNLYCVLGFFQQITLDDQKCRKYMHRQNVEEKNLRHYRV